MMFRSELLASDRDAIERIVSESGFFTPAEIAVALELVDDPTGHYQFVIAEDGDEVLGYSCYGHISITESSYDLYWIVVDRTQRGGGIGRALMEETEKRIRDAGGTRLYAETSSQSLYESTQRFYEHTGFVLEATIRDFYKSGDNKLIYTRALTLS